MQIHGHTTKQTGDNAQALLSFCSTDEAAATPLLRGSALATGQRAPPRCFHAPIVRSRPGGLYLAGICAEVNNESWRPYLSLSAQVFGVASARSAPRIIKPCCERDGLPGPEAGRPELIVAASELRERIRELLRRCGVHVPEPV